MGDWLTATQVQTESVSPYKSQFSETRIGWMINRAESQAKALGLDTAKAGFDDTAKETILQAVEAFMELNRPLKSMAVGRRSFTYDREAVGRILLQGFAGYYDSTTRLIR